MIRIKPSSQGHRFLAGSFVLIALILSTTPAGAFWLAEERLTNDPSPSQTSPNNAWCVTFDTTGNVSVVWTDYRDGPAGIYHKACDGFAWSSDTLISLPAAAAYSPAVTADAIGNIHAVWTDYRHGNSEIYYRAFDGSAWGASERISSNSSNSFAPSVTASDSGQVHIVWQDYRDYDWEIYYRTFDGAVWSPEQRLTSHAGNSLYAAIAVGGDGTVHVAWQDSRDGNNEIYYKRFDGTWSVDERLTADAGASEHPSITVSAAGDVHMAWTDDRDGGWEIYHKVRVSGVWGVDERLTYEPAASTAPSIAADTSGGVHIVWKDERHGNEEIYYRGHDGMAWGAEQCMTNDEGTSEHPSIATGQAGDMAMVWQDDRDGNSEIYARRFVAGSFPPPMITSIMPSQGHTDSVATITDLAGEGFFFSAAVRLQLSDEPDVVATDVVVESAERITCLLDLTGVSGGSWDVVVENPDGKRDTLDSGFEVIPWAKPSLTSVVPDRGYVGQTLDDVGLFGADLRDPALVWFEKPEEPDLPATDITVISPSEVRFDLDLTGVALGDWTVILENPDGKRDTLEQAFGVWPWPDVAVTSVIPSGGYPGEHIDDLEILGDGFMSPARAWIQRLGQTRVLTSNLVVHSPFRITCDISLPDSGIGLWDVVVENPDLELGTLVEGFLVAHLDAPDIASIYPFEGVAGERVVITDLAGNNFHELATVWLQNSQFGAIPAEGIVVESPQRITFELDLPEAVQGYFDAVVMHPDGLKDTLPSAFHVIQGEWGADTRLTDAAGASNLSKGNARCMAADGLGNLHSVWFDERHGNSEIYYRMHDGVSWGAEVRITTAANESENPAIAVDTDNTVYIFWADRMRGDWEIYYISKDLSGWSEIQCLTDAQAWVNHPSVATDTDNDVHVVWESLDPSYGYQIIYARTQNSVWLPPDTLSLPYNHRYPAIAIDGTNTAHVAWRMKPSSDACIRYTRSDGSPWEPHVSLVCRPEIGAPSLCADADGKLHLAFHDQRFGNFEVFYKHFDGSDWLPAVRLSDAPAKSLQPSVVSDGAGEVTVVWSDERHADYTYEIYSRRFDGASWKPEGRLTYVPGTSSIYPTAALDIAGAFHVIWSDDRDGNFEIYHKIRGEDASAGFGDEQVAGAAADPIRVLPNPFRGGVEIRFARPSDEHALVSIYDVSGRLVWTRRVSPGPDNRMGATWDGHSSDGKRVAPGVYLVKVKAGKHTALAKIVMLK